MYTHIYIYIYIYTYYTYATGWTKMVFTVPTYYSWGVIQVLTNMEHVQLVDHWDFLGKTWKLGQVGQWSSVSPCKWRHMMNQQNTLG